MNPSVTYSRTSGTYFCIYTHLILSLFFSCRFLSRFIYMYVHYTSSSHSNYVGDEHKKAYCRRKKKRKKKEKKRYIVLIIVMISSCKHISTERLK